jgi:hypothetical protein
MYSSHVNAWMLVLVIPRDKWHQNNTFAVGRICTCAVASQVLPFWWSAPLPQAGIYKGLPTNTGICFWNSIADSNSNQVFQNVVHNQISDKQHSTRYMNGLPCTWEQTKMEKVTTYIFTFLRYRNDTWAAPASWSILMMQQPLY